MKNKNQFLLIFIFSQVFFLFSSCNYLQMMNKFSRTNQPESVIMGNIRTESELPHIFMVLAYSTQFMKKKYNYIILNQPGNFMLYLPDGKYRLYVFADYDDNYVFCSNEIAGVYPEDIQIDKGEIKTKINIHIAGTNNHTFPFPVQISHDYKCLSQNQNIKKKIYDQIFSLDNAKIGWWFPDDFIKALGCEIYLTQDYDPKKIPVLFIHGAIGSPHNFTHLHIRINKKKYQPWFFYYPSGLRLPLISKILSVKLNDLYKEYKFNKICIIAHSMGGLVIRGMLTDSNNKKQNDQVNTFIAIASPWSGFESADTAVKRIPVVLPSWIDMASKSTFIKKIYNKNLPSHINYYLFYGKKDKTAAYRSLDQRARNEARTIFGLDEDHESILASKRLYRELEKLLNENFHIKKKSFKKIETDD